MRIDRLSDIMPEYFVISQSDTWGNVIAERGRSSMALRMEVNPQTIGW